MSDDPANRILAYHQAWNTFKAAQTRAAEVVDQALKQLACLENWKKWVHSPVAEMTNARQAFNPSAWPSGRDLDAALKDFLNQCHALKRCWESLRTEERNGFQPPPSA